MNDEDGKEEVLRRLMTMNDNEQTRKMCPSLSRFERVSVVVVVVNLTNTHELVTVVGLSLTVTVLTVTAY